MKQRKKTLAVRGNAGKRFKKQASIVIKHKSRKDQVRVTRKSNFTIFFGIFLVSMLFVPPSMPFMVPEAEASHSRVLNLIAPSDWISESGCESTPEYTPTYSTQCTEVPFGNDEILIFEKHHDPGEIQKAEIFIDKLPSGGYANSGTEIFSRWNLGGDTTCVSGMTMHGTASAQLVEGEWVYDDGPDGPTNSVCNGTIIVTRDDVPNGQGSYKIKIDTAMLADGIHSITMNTYIGSVYSATYTIEVDTTPPVMHPAYYGISVDVEGTNADIHYNGPSVSLGENGCVMAGTGDCHQSLVEMHGDFDGVKETLTFLMMLSDDVTVGPSCSDGITEGVVSAGGSSGWWYVHFSGYVGTTSFSNATGTWLVGTQNMTCTASDAAGNTVSKSFVVNTYYKQPDPPADTTPPELTIVPFGCINSDLDDCNISVVWTDEYGHHYNSFYIACQNFLDIGEKCLLPHPEDKYWSVVLKDMTLNISNSTGIQNFFYVNPRVSNNGVDAGSTSCSPSSSAFGLWTQADWGGMTTLPVGTTVITCEADNEDLTAAYTINVVNTADTTPPDDTTSLDCSNYCTFGSQGSNNNQFNNPFGLALDNSGNIYVADKSNNRIQKFDSSGNYLMTITGNLTEPKGVTVDNNGNIYVADPSGEQVRQFSSTGTAGWTSTFQAGSNPQDVAVDNSGNAYIAHSDTVDRHDHGSGDGNFYGFSTHCSFGGDPAYWLLENIQFPACNLSETKGVAVDSSGNVYVANEGNVIQKFGPSGNLILSIGSFDIIGGHQIWNQGTGNGEFDRPMRIAVDNSGNIYVTDFNNDRVQKFDSSGNHILSFGTEGSGAGQFNGPIGIEVDSSGKIYVAEIYNHRVQIFSPSYVNSLPSLSTSSADTAAAEQAAAAAAEAAAAVAAAAVAAAAEAAAAAASSLAASDAVWVEANPGMVKNALGSSTPGCEDTNSCFIPSTIAISTGDTVTWVNTDNAAHTVTSGTPAGGLSGVFDSSLMMAGSVSFSHTFDTAGTYPYHCMVHPWMLGTVIVTGAAVEEEIVIPAWIKNNAGWWDAGLIDDRNYVTGLQWLISNGVMTIPSTAQGTGSDDVVPSWVKNNAGWWADGSIDDRNYVTGLQWLITNGVMIIG